MLFKPLGQSQGIIRMSLYPERQSFKPLQQKEGIKWSLRRTKISQSFNPGTDRKCNIGKAQRISLAKYFPKFQSVITLGRLSELRKFSIAPIIISGIHNNASYNGTVPPNPFGCRFHNDIRPPFNGPAEVS